MKIYVNGLELVTTGNYDVPAFLDELAREQFHSVEYQGNERAITAEREGEFVIGALLTKKDQQQFLTWGADPETGRPVITVERTIGGLPMADFSFFVIKADSGFGLLSQYQGSGGVTRFGNVLGMVFKKLAAQQAERLREELAESGEDPDKRPNAKAIAAVRNSHLRSRPMMKDGQFTRELRRLTRIRAIDYVEPQVSEPLFATVRKHLSRVAKSISFKPESPAAEVRNFLAKFVPDREISEGRIYGKLNDGQDFSFPIGEDVYCFQKYRYDETVAGESFRFPGANSSPLIQKMLAITQSHAELFVRRQ